MLDRLKEYHEKNNTFEIEAPPNSPVEGLTEEEKASRKSKEEVRLWLKEQNQQFAHWREDKRSSMSEEKIQLLANIGLTLQYTTFAERVEELKQYQEQQQRQDGTVGEMPPATHPLFKWIKKVRGQLQRLEEGKQGVKLSAEQAQQLREQVGAFFPVAEQPNEEAEDRKWDEMYEKLKAYKEEHGDCLVSTSNYTDPLVKWVLAQRRYYRYVHYPRVSLSQSAIH